MADWADAEAEVHLRYLGKCRDRKEGAEYLAAALRKVADAAASRGAGDLWRAQEAARSIAPKHG